MGAPLHTDLAKRAGEVRDLIQKEKKNIEKGYIALAQLLHETWENAYFIRWAYDSFQEYCQEELGIQYRRAKYYVSIADTVKKLGIEWEEIEDIGWTKMRVLLPIIEEDPKGWITLAEAHPVRELEAMVKDAKDLGIDITSQGDEKVISLSLKMTQSQADIIFSALDKAKEAIESESNEMALEQISYDYVMSIEDTNTPLPNIISWIERNYGVKIEVKEQADVEDVLQETT
jgi:hypothetical protein